MSRKPAKHHVLDPFAHLLGTMPDAKIAEMAGVSRTLVLYRRQRDGIEAYGNRSKGRSGGRRGRKSVLLPFVELMGIRSDAEIARMAGCNKDNVTSYRRRHGIRSSVSPTVGAFQGPSPRPGSEAIGVPVVWGGLPLLVQDSSPSKKQKSFICTVVDVPGLYLVRAADFATAAQLAQEVAKVRFPRGAVRSLVQMAELEERLAVASGSAP